MGWQGQDRLQSSPRTDIHLPKGLQVFKKPHDISRNPPSVPNGILWAEDK